MLGAILPRDGEPRPVGVTELRPAGHRYIAELGWSVFLERTGRDGKRKAIANCEDCRSAEFGHDREACACLACHGFYAATRDHNRWDTMCDALPNATHLGVRTGQASGIFVVDFDVKHGGPQLHHEWSERTGLDWSFPSTRTHRTKSGGFHLLYRLPPGESVGSHNGVNGLRGVDVKGDGGLVIAPPSPGYSRLPGSDIADPGESVLRWAREARGSGYRIPQITGGVGGTPLPLDQPCPEGVRDDFANALAFTLRKMGLSQDEAANVIRPHWENMEGHGTEGEFPWKNVLYKIRRVWATVEPDRDVVAGRRWWIAMSDTRAAVDRGEPVQIGKKTVVVRNSHSVGGDR